MRGASVVSRVAIPTPEEAGLDESPASRAPDWNAVHRQLSALGAKGFGLEPTPRGQRFSIVLADGRRVEGEGRDGAEAAAQALDKARRAR